MDKRNAPKGSEPISEPVIIMPNEIVKVTKMNHIIEVQHMEKMNRKANIKKLDKDTYVELSTGEIKDFTHSENRQQNYNSLRQTFKRLRYLINNNFVGQANELHVTLTYKKNMTDTKQLYEDFDKFMKRLRYKYRKETSIDYLTVMEPQGRGAWHGHCLMRFNDLESIYIPNKFNKRNQPVDAPLFDIWGKGWVTIRSLNNVDNIGAYLSAYLADVEFTEDLDGRAIHAAVVEEREILTKVVDGQEKKFIKGGRLHRYPPGMNLYRKSKGIIEPEQEEMRFREIKKVVGSAQPHYQKAYHIQNDDFENTISFLQYNTKRQNDNTKN